MATGAGRVRWGAAGRRRAAVGVVGVVAASVLTGCLHTERVSVSSSGAEANGPSRAAGISGDGRFVAFTSTASNLVAGDTNGVADLFVRDNVTGAVQRTSLEADGTQLDGAGVTQGTVSSDGRYATFATEEAATPTDTDDAADLFVRDRTTGTTALASIAPDGQVATPVWGRASRNGRFVVASAAGYGVFVRDLAAGTSRTVDPFLFSDQFAVSDDGEVVAAVTTSDLLPDDPGGTYDVYVLDDGDGSVQRLAPSIATDRTHLQHGALQLAVDLSPDGRHVAWSALRGSVSPEAFVHDRLLGTTERLPDMPQPPGSTADPRELLPTVSADGRYVAYARNGEDEYHRTRFELVVRDRARDTTTVVETLPSWWASPLLLSADGRWTAFTASTAEGTDDTNGVDDVYLRFAHDPVIRSVSPATLGPGTHQVTIAVDEAWGTPEVVVSGTGVTVSSVTPGPGGLTVSLEVSASAAPGARNVEVRNRGDWAGRALLGGATACGACLTITG